MKSALRAISIVCISFAATYCSVKPCYDETETMVITGLFASGTGEVKKSTSLVVAGAKNTGPDTLLTAKSVEYFSLPLDPGASSVELYVTLNGETDTVLITYENYPHMVSPECGYTFYSNIIKLWSTHHLVDTILIENKNVTLNGERNLRLFY